MILGIIALCMWAVIGIVILANPKSEIKKIYYVILWLTYMFTLFNEIKI